MARSPSKLGTGLDLKRASADVSCKALERANHCYSHRNIASFTVKIIAGLALLLCLLIQHWSFLWRGQSSQQLQKVEPHNHTEGAPDIHFRDLPHAREAILQVMANKEAAKKALWQRWLPAEEPAKWRQHMFKPHGLHSFIQFSAYRIDESSFAAVGLAAAKLRNIRALHGCHWFGYDPEPQYQGGTLAAFYQSSVKYSAPENLQYEVIVLKCTFPESTGKSGGHVIMQLDFESILAYNEVENQTYELAAPATFKHDLAYCGAGWHDGMIAPQVREWMEWHRVLHEVDHFYLYDAGGIDENMLAMLDPYEKAGLVTLTNIQEVLLLSIKYWGQPLAIADCIYRTRWTSKWVLMQDPDEYLHVVPPNTLKGLLQRHSRVPFLTHGSYDWDTEHCAGEGGDGTEKFMVERALKRKKLPHCILEKEFPRERCLAFWGHRKSILNPRKVVLPDTHSEEHEPPAGEERGVDLDAVQELRHHHYRGLATTEFRGPTCSKPLEDPVNQTYILSYEVASLAAVVRQCPLGTSKDCFIQNSRRTGGVTR